VTPPTILYFAYGSNLRASQMDRLCPGHQFLGAARLDDHRLAFTLPDEEWQGGVADLLPSPGHHVWGALYTIDAAGLASLDHYEGYAPDAPDHAHAYVRRPIRVRTAQGSCIDDVWCYFVRPPHTHVPPSAPYRHALLQGARERHLPTAYIETLEHLLRTGEMEPPHRVITPSPPRDQKLSTEP